MFATSKYPKISIFIPIAQSWHFRVMAAILKKKWRLWKSSLIVPSYSPHQIQHVPAGITSLAIILSEILNVKVEKYEKNNIKRAINSYIVSRIVTKIAQQIDLIILNDLRSFGILISAFVFELLNVKVEKVGKKREKRAITPTWFHGSSPKNTCLF